jgi:hypothetical protein
LASRVGSIGDQQQPGRAGGTARLEVVEAAIQRIADRGGRARCEHADLPLDRGMVRGRTGQRLHGPEKLTRPTRTGAGSRSIRPSVVRWIAPNRVGATSSETVLYDTSTTSSTVPGRLVGSSATDGRAAVATKPTIASRATTLARFRRAADRDHSGDHSMGNHGSSCGRLSSHPGAFVIGARR